MNEEDLVAYLTQTFAGVETAQNFGYTFFFHGPDHRLPFATLATADNEHDRVSQLDRPGVFRLNLGVSKATFEALFGPDPVDQKLYNFAALDEIMPHPHYAPQHYICVLNPGGTSAARVRTLLKEAYEIAARRDQRRAR